MTRWYLTENGDDPSYIVGNLQEEYELADLNMDMTKCEYLSMSTDKTYDHVLDDYKIKKSCKYLRVIFNKQGNSGDEISEGINKSRAIT